MGPMRPAAPTSTPSRPTAAATNRRRSHRELRLEQIAIWGDAAALTTHAPTDLDDALLLPPPSAARPATYPASSPRPPCDPHANALENAVPIDVALLLAAEPVAAEGLAEASEPSRVVVDARLRADVGMPATGTMRLCNSRSADRFRRSGSYAAVARAAQQLQATTDASFARPRAMSVAGAAERTEVSFSRPRAISIAAAVPRRPVREPRWSGALFPERRSSVRRAERRRSEMEAEPDLEAVWEWQRDCIGLRERDENDFRLSNAKLPERVESVSAPPVADGLMIRRCRSSTPALGRYTRSRASQLPVTRTTGRIEPRVDAR